MIFSRINASINESWRIKWFDKEVEMRKLLKMENKFIWKREQNYIWERTLVYMFKGLVMKLVNTPITPNMLTLFNLIVNVPICCILAWNRHYILLALFIQIYCIFDILDGNLARNKHLSSKLGKILDNISDYIFYGVVFLVTGYRMDISFIIVICSVAVQYIYGFIATFYIAPFIRGNNNFKRTKLKQFFYDRGILFGMDATLQTIIASVFLLTGIGEYLFIFDMTLWVLDLIYRIYEMKVQKYL